MSGSAQERERFHATTRQEWRDWLAANYATSSGVWLVSYRTATGKPCVGYGASVEEALCFGWIDSVRKVLDDERSMQLFTPRQPGSQWSRANKERLARLTEQGRMAPAGLARVAAAKEDGNWSLYDAVEDLAEPEDVMTALDAEPAARQGFDAFSPSVKKQVLWWVMSAKRPETRARRVTELVMAAVAGRNPIDWRANRAEKSGGSS